MWSGEYGTKQVSAHHYMHALVDGITTHSTSYQRTTVFSHTRRVSPTVSLEQGSPGDILLEWEYREYTNTGNK